jgi:hypothetical protein
MQENMILEEIERKIAEKPFRVQVKNQSNRWARRADFVWKNHILNKKLEAKKEARNYRISKKINPLLAKAHGLQKIAEEPQDKEDDSSEVNESASSGSSSGSSSSSSSRSSSSNDELVTNELANPVKRGNVFNQIQNIEGEEPVTEKKVRNWEWDVEEEKKEENVSHFDNKTTENLSHVNSALSNTESKLMPTEDMLEMKDRQANLPVIKKESLPAASKPKISIKEFLAKKKA